MNRGLFPCGVSPELLLSVGRLGPSWRMSSYSMSVQQVRVHVCLTALGVPELLIYFQFFFEFSRAEVLPGRVSGASFHTFMLTFRC